MAFGNWDDVYNVYKNLYPGTKYDVHAKEMMSLIPRIRQHPSFTEVLLGTSHATLFLELPTMDTSVRIWGEQKGEYSVYLSHSDKGDTDDVKVNSDEIIPTLVKYLDRICRV